MTEEDLAVRLLSNPVYAVKISPTVCMPLEPLISEDDFIKAGVKLIEDIGAESYLRNLLENLKGNYIAADGLEGSLR